MQPPLGDHLRMLQRIQRREARTIAEVRSLDLSDRPWDKAGGGAKIFRKFIPTSCGPNSVADQDKFHWSEFELAGLWSQ